MEVHALAIQAQKNSVLPTIRVAPQGIFRFDGVPLRVSELDPDAVLRRDLCGHTPGPAAQVRIGIRWGSSYPFAAGSLLLCG